MDSSNQGQVFKGLLNEFSGKPYISVSHNLYPIDHDDEKPIVESPPLSDFSGSSSGEEKEDSNTISTKPKKGQFADIAKLNIFINLSPQDFLEIKKQFSHYDEGVSVTQFILIILEVLTTSVTYNEKNSDFIRSVIQLYQMIDVFGHNRINFDQLSNFLVEMHEILGRDQSLFEIKFKMRPVEQAFENVPIERLFELPGFKGFGYLDQSLRTLRIVNPTTWEELLNISIGATSIVGAYYLQKRNSLIITSNDRFMNFFDMQSHKLQRRFMLPDVQTFIQYSNRKGVIYTGAVNGTMYCWDLEKIYSKEFLKAMNKHPDCFKLALIGQPMQELDFQPIETTMMDHLIEVRIKVQQALEIMATGSSDTVIRLFDNKRNLSSNHKELRGHAKAIKALSYCGQYKYLISCSYDFDVLIWNIYLDHPLAKLVGHEAPLLMILNIQEKRPYKFSLILSCDAKGILRVWDPKTFQTIQVLSVTDGESQRVKSIIYKREYSTVLLGHKHLQLYEIDQSFDPNITDDHPLIAMCFSSKYFELHLASAHAIKTWDLQKGSLKRIYKDVNEGVITAMEGVGRPAYRINNVLGMTDFINSIIDIFTGFKMKVFKDFTKEVCYLGYSGEYNLIVSAGWDRQVRIYKDFNERDKKPDKDCTIEFQQLASLRIIKNSHLAEVSLSQFSEHLMLIATATREGEIRLWDFEKCNFVSKLRTTGKEILAMEFLEPYPLLVTTDTNGSLCVHIVRPHKLEFQLAVVWKNMFTIMKAAQVTCLDHFILKNDELRLVLGDENGDIRVLDLQEVLKSINIRPINFEEISQNKNLHRFFQLIFQEYETNPVAEKPATEGLVSEKAAKQLTSWKAHKLGIKSIIVVQDTHEPTIVSLGNDRFVRLWSLKGGPLGVLRQGFDPNSPSPAYFLRFKNTFRTEVEKIDDDVKKNFEQSKLYKEKLRKAKTVPFKKEEQNFGSLGHVESKEIFKDLQEITRYLEKKQEQDAYQAKQDKQVKRK